MRILFLHNNFPAQFGKLGQYLNSRGWDVWFGTQAKSAGLPGINLVRYDTPELANRLTHEYALNYENAVANGAAVLKMAEQMKRTGFIPDVVVAHAGWGPGIFIKDVWPDTRYAGYFEWYYNRDRPDSRFLQPGLNDTGQNARAYSRNAAILLDLAQSDLAFCPTHWQKAQFPEVLQSQLTVLHDGIDTDYFTPDENATFKWDGRTYTRADEIITYVARGMEPYRGFPQFMSALSKLQKLRPNLEAIIVGEDRVAYGAMPEDGRTFKEQALQDLPLDESRICFTGLLPYSEYRKVLQVSAAHFYFSIPFVLSWSAMEAMSSGCAIIASDTPPVTEVATGFETAVLTPFFDRQATINAIYDVLENQEKYMSMRQNARSSIIKKYKIQDIFRQKEMLLQDILT